MGGILKLARMAQRDVGSSSLFNLNALHLNFDIILDWNVTTENLCFWFVNFNPNISAVDSKSGGNVGIVGKASFKYSLWSSTYK